MNKLLKKLLAVVVIGLAGGLVSAIMQSVFLIESPSAYITLGLFIGIALSIYQDHEGGQ